MTKSSSRCMTATLVTWLMPMRVPNSGEVTAPRLPVSNCRYPTGVNVAGVETVGRAGFASGIGSLMTCAVSRKAHTKRPTHPRVLNFMNFLQDSRDGFSAYKRGLLRDMAAGSPSRENSASRMGLHPDPVRKGSNNPRFSHRGHTLTTKRRVPTSTHIRIIAANVCTWRTHSCVPHRDSSRCLPRARIIRNRNCERRY